MPQPITYGVPRKNPGPVAWCNRCSRKHPRQQPCDMYLRERMTRGGTAKSKRQNGPRKVRRWAA